jgi:polysaccharide pyruvyl transferase WcaK-like protein
VLSIGGDIYTLWHGEETATHFGRVERAHTIMDSGKPVVLWGASVGPFEVNPCAVAAFSSVLQRMALIAVREPVTMAYLQQLGVSENATLMADPAFVMTVGRVSRRAKPTIAVNLSPLSANYIYGRGRRAQALKAQAGVVVRLIRECGVNVLLVPHVVCPWHPNDDDYGYLAELQTSIPPEFRGRVELLPAGLGARRTKQVISSCVLAIAARMHCAIAALSMAVPTLLLSYSPKSVGMCEYVYGSREWVLPVDAGPDSILDTVKRLLKQSDAIGCFLSDRMPSVKADAVKAVDRLVQVIT